MESNKNVPVCVKVNMREALTYAEQVSSTINEILSGMNGDIQKKWIDKKIAAEGLSYLLKNLMLSINESYDKFLTDRDQENTKGQK